MTRIGMVWLLALGMLMAAPVHAQFEAGYAHVDEIDGEISHSLIGSWLRPIERWKAYDVHSEVVAGWIMGRDGFPHPDDDDIFFAGGGLRKYFGSFYLGAGVVVLDHTNTLLSSTGQFVTSLGYGRKHWVLGFRHISNANTAGNNDGENLLSLSYRW